MNAWEAVTIDSSLLYPTTSRRYLATLWEMHGAKVRLMPRTSLELWGLLRQSENDQWVRQLKGDAERSGRTLPAQTQQDIKEAVKEAAGQWINDEIGYKGSAGRADSALVCQWLDVKAQVQADEIAVRIPQACFRGPSQDGHRGDRQIIAEACVAQMTVLASNNRWSIRRRAANEWLKEKGLTNRELVLKAENAIETAIPWREHAARMFEAALRATLPDKPRPAAREKEIIDTFLKRLARQGLPGIASLLEATYGGPDAAMIIDRAREAIQSGLRSRSTEARRVQAVRRAARAAGWGR